MRRMPSTASLSVLTSLAAAGAYRNPALRVRDDRDTSLLKRGGTAGISNAVSINRRSEILTFEAALAVPTQEMRMWSL